MTYDNLLNVVHWYTIKPWLYDFYHASFSENLNLQQFADYAHDKTSGDVEGWQIYVQNNSAYFAVPKAKNQTIAEDFAPNFSKIEDVPQEEPPAEETQVQG
jgi:hypothetical protein